MCHIVRVPVVTVCAWLGGGGGCGVTDMWDKSKGKKQVFVQYNLFNDCLYCTVRC